MYFTIMDDDRAFGETLKNKLESEYHAVVDVYHGMVDLDQIKHVPDILFLDVIFDCPYELQELVCDSNISQILSELSEKHKALFYFLFIKSTRKV